MNNKMSGEYRFTVLDSNGKIKRETDWMPNLITNIGLDYLGGRNVVGQYCRIGTGNSAPAFTDTALVSQSASTSNLIVANSRVNNGAPNYETVISCTYQFAQGAVSGNMAEVGIGWATTGATLFSRALIVDGAGTPTTISVLASEILQVSYRLKLYPQTTDSTGTVTIGSETYTYTARAANIGSTRSYSLTSNPFGSTTINLYAGLMGPITGTPSGATTNVTPTYSTYTNGTYFYELTLNADLNQGNVAGGIRSLSVVNNFAYTQMEFDRAILKDNTKQLTILFRHAFARRS